MSSQRQLPSSSHRLPAVSASQVLFGLETEGPIHVATGLSSLDAALTGSTKNSGAGFELTKVTEIWGPSGVGKTAIVLNATAVALSKQRDVVWIDGRSSLSKERVEATLLRHCQPDTNVSTPGLLARFHHRVAPTLSHLLATVLHPRPDFPPPDTVLLVIEDLHTLVELEYPRKIPAVSARSEQQKWQAGRRFAVLGSLVTALNKLAVLVNLAVVITTGCTTRMRSDSGLGAALVPGVGGSEWDAGVWTRAVVFRDFAGRFIGLQKRQGRGLISRQEVGEVGGMLAFEIKADGTLCEGQQSPQEQDQNISAAVRKSPNKARKRPFAEVADSDGEDVDEYGWEDADEDAFATGLENENGAAAEDGIIS